MDHRPSAQRGAENRKFYQRLTADLKAAVRHEIRYKTKDHNGQTRTERNLLAQHPMPVQHIPDEGRDLWLLFWQLNALRVDRQRVMPSEIANWLRLHGRPIATVEMPVIEAMDRQFLETLAEETAFNEERRKGGGK